MANCTPPVAGAAAYYTDGTVDANGALNVWSATITAAGSGNRADLNVAGLGTRSNVPFSQCFGATQAEAWTCHATYNVSTCAGIQIHLN